MLEILVNQDQLVWMETLDQLGFKEVQVMMDLPVTLVREDLLDPVDETVPLELMDQLVCTFVDMEASQSYSYIRSCIYCFI